MDQALKEAIDNLGSSFEEFKSANDERIKAVEKGQPTADVDAKLVSIEADMLKFSDVKKGLDKVLAEREAEKAANDATITGLEKQIADLAKRSGVGPAGEKNPAVAEHRQAYDKFLRKGREEGLGDLQVKALSIGTDTDGGFAVPEELDRNLIELERRLVPMRQVCGQINVSTPDYMRLVSVGSAGSGWVGESDARPETATPQLRQVKAVMGELYANPAATQHSLDDIYFDADAWLINEIGIAFSEAENGAFTSGDGTNKPRGFLAQATSADTDQSGTRPFGTLQEIVTSTSGAIGGDDLLNLIYSLRSGYRGNGWFMFNTLALAALRKLKDGDENYLWRPGLEEGQPDRLLGYGMVENDDMPDVAAGSFSVAFGDFRRGYLIVDRVGTRVLRDPYTNKPFVHFYTTKRVGGMPTDTNAIKLLKTAA